MMWPWQRHRAQVLQARNDRDDAARRANAAEVQRNAAERLAEQSQRVTARLRNEVEKNGWTEMLQHAWGGR
ncbi:hypothetical protein A5746_20945 [Mycolicibacterium conceptionense]|uniref:DUF7620 family protein n=1 Tax=Mycolicibacterium conceptionense TaxID=451644 RepID=UPI00097A3131|nr:hypothetical protein A5746_20945 [Mycolicibacterium conceptionense]